MDTYTYFIDPQQVDFQNKISLSKLTGIILDAAGKSAEEKGFSVIELLKNDLTWVISRIAIEMQYYPRSGETIEVQTWVANAEGKFSTRNFRIFCGGKIIGYATTSWAVIHLKTRQVMPLSTLEQLASFTENVEIPFEETIAIGKVDGNPVNDFSVKYSDVDFNRHANSLRYIDWICDSFSPDFYSSKKLKRFDINFLREIAYGNSGKIFMEDKNNEDYYFQMLTESGTVCCKARMLFETK